MTATAFSNRPLPQVGALPLPATKGLAVSYALSCPELEGIEVVFSLLPGSV